MTKAAGELSKLESKKEHLSMQINEHIHESKRIKERHDRLENRIKDFIPQKGDTELDMSNKKDVIFLPD